MITRRDVRTHCPKCGATIEFVYKRDEPGYAQAVCLECGARVEVYVSFREYREAVPDSDPYVVGDSNSND